MIFALGLLSPWKSLLRVLWLLMARAIAQRAIALCRSEARVLVLLARELLVTWLDLLPRSSIAAPGSLQSGSLAKGDCVRSFASKAGCRSRCVSHHGVAFACTFRTVEGWNLHITVNEKDSHECIRSHRQAASLLPCV